MSVNEKLLGCFAAIFPKVAKGDIPSLTAELYEDWDSIATVTLVAVVEEEFGLAFTTDELSAFTSFDSIAEIVQRKV